ncbi:MAG: alpha/beta fold hydrolase [Sterolibacterium sp.]|nr:alpha/beta fold hydrolase [Sterolibacterium sp.]
MDVRAGAATGVSAEAWLIRSSAVSGTHPPPRLRLYCFPYSGGNAVAFVPWQRELAPAIELCAVQLPGRGARYAEPVYTAFNDLIAALTAVVQQCQAQSPLPFAFYGHSLGALMAFELACHHHAHGLPLPGQLLLSGCNPPPLPTPMPCLHQLPDDELIQRLRSYEGTPEEILGNRELMALLLPTIRADFALGADYQRRYDVRRPTLPMPLSVLAGRSDPHVTVERLREWQRTTHGRYQEHWFDGGHFFIQKARQQVLACLKKTLLDCDAGLRTA